MIQTNGEKVFAIYLDGIQYGDPLGWEKWEEILERTELNGLLLRVNLSLEFNGKAFEYLLRQYKRLGRDGQVAFRLVDSHAGQAEYLGKIFLVDIEWDLSFCKAKAPIQDESFYAKVNNNKNVKATVSAGISKNQVKIPAARPYLLGLRTIAAGTIFRTIYSVRVEEAFRYLVDFMTDGQMGFRSETFGIDGEWAGLCLTSGQKISGSGDYDVPGDTPIPEFSYQDLYTIVGKKIPLGFRIEKTGSKYFLRVEALDMLFDDTRMATLENITGLKLTTDREKLYAKMRVGSTTTLDDPSLGFPEDITLFGFKDEEFPLLGTSNIDASLDIVEDWIVSSNCIERAGEDPGASYDGEYDDEITLIDSTVDDLNGGSSVNTNFLNLSPPRYFFNERLTNNRVAERFLSSIPSSLFKQIFPDDAANTFSAERNALVSYFQDKTIGRQAQYLTEIADPGANYVPSIYTAPSGGIFTFRATQVINIATLYLAPVILWQLQLVHFDASGAEKGRYDLHDSNWIGPGGTQYHSNAIAGFFTLGGNSKQLNMASGDYVMVALYKSLAGAGDIDWEIHTSSIFECTQAIIQGAAYVENTSLEFRAYQYFTDDAIPLNIYEKIKARQTGTILLQDAFGNSGEGAIQNLTYNRLNSKAKITLTAKSLI